MTDDDKRATTGPHQGIVFHQIPDPPRTPHVCRWAWAQTVRGGVVRVCPGCGRRA